MVISILIVKETKNSGKDIREKLKTKLSMAKMKFATFHSLTIVNLSLCFIKIRARTKQNFKGDSEQNKN